MPFLFSAPLSSNININDKISRVDKLQLFNIQRPINCVAIQSIEYGPPKQKQKQKRGRSQDKEVDVGRGATGLQKGGGL